MVCRVCSSQLIQLGKHTLRNAAGAPGSPACFPLESRKCLRQGSYAAGIHRGPVARLLHLQPDPRQSLIEGEPHPRPPGDEITKAKPPAPRSGLTGASEGPPQDPPVEVGVVAENFSPCEPLSNLGCHLAERRCEGESLSADAVEPRRRWRDTGWRFDQSLEYPAVRLDDGEFHDLGPGAQIRRLGVEGDPLPAPDNPPERPERIPPGGPDRHPEAPL